MEDKYYIPDIEELRIGYKCEWYGAIGLKHEYMPIIMDAKWINIAVNNGIQFFRVKYLTKEDIELEGWVKITSALDRYPNAWEKENHFLLFYPTKDNQIEIVMKDVTKDDYLENTSNGRGFAGKCKSINELKTISKLLNI